MVQVQSPRRAVVDVRVAVLLVLALIAALAAFAVADGEEPAAGLDLGTACVDSTPPGVIADAAAEGFECTTLYNKGNPGTGVGRLFVRLQEGEVTLVTDLYSLPDDGHSDVKLCIDDDAAPRESSVSCLGGTAATTVSRSYSIGEGRNDVKPAGDTYETDGSKYEYLLEDKALTTGSAPFGSGFAAYTAKVGLPGGPAYEDFSFHFNQSSMSIESFLNLEPESITLTCDENRLFGGGDEPTYLVRLEGDGDPCEKQVLFSAGSASQTEGTTQFVDLRPAVAGQARFMFLEEIRWLGIEAGEPPRPLFYDDVHDETVVAREMPTCLQDPRADGAFDIDASYTVATAEAAVLPATHTSCLVEQRFTIGDDETVSAFHIVFNVGDGLRMY